MTKRILPDKNNLPKTPTPDDITSALIVSLRAAHQEVEGNPSPENLAALRRAVDKAILINRDNNDIPWFLRIHTDDLPDFICPGCGMPRCTCGRQGGR